VLQVCVLLQSCFCQKELPSAFIVTHPPGCCLHPAALLTLTPLPPPPCHPSPHLAPGPRSRPAQTAEQEVSDAVFAQAYIPKKLDDVANPERDHARLAAGTDTGGLQRLARWLGGRVVAG
jgi:hypothetical protein